MIFTNLKSLILINCTGIFPQKLELHRDQGQGPETSTHNLSSQLAPNQPQNSPCLEPRLAALICSKRVVFYQNLRLGVKLISSSECNSSANAAKPSVACSIEFRLRPSSLHQVQQPRPPVTARLVQPAAPITAALVTNRRLLRVEHEAGSE